MRRAATRGRQEVAKTSDRVAVMRAGQPAEARAEDGVARHALEAQRAAARG